MKVAITGEGPTDYGAKDYESGQWEWGPVAVYVEKIAADEGKPVELYPIERKDIENMKLQKRSTLGLKGKGIPARKFAILMQKEKCDMGIYYCDADRESGTKNSSALVAEKRYKEVYQDIENGLESFEAIPMIALRMIECWMLSDKKALESVYRIKLSTADLPGKPELIWGDKSDPEGNYPKQYLVRIIRNADKRYRDYVSDRTDFIDIASNTDIKIIRQKCSISFERFYRDFVEMLKKAE